MASYFVQERSTLLDWRRDVNFSRNRDICGKTNVWTSIKRKVNGY